MIMELMRKTIKCRLGVHCGKVITVALLFVVSMTLSSCGGFVKAVPAGAGAVKKDFVAEARAAIVSADKFMGDWKGSWKLNDGTDSGPLVAQVIALGGGKYQANFLEEFDTRDKPIGVLSGLREGAVVRLTGQANHKDTDVQVQAVIKGDKLNGTFKAQDKAGILALERAIRVSPTMGAKPPKGAVVLFDGKNFDQWKRARVKAGEDDKVKWELVAGAMRVTRGGGNIITRKSFTDVKLHIEFFTPFMPEKRGQGRGNSGVYLQGRYEVQVLDSYGLEGRDNECGGIYKVKQPRVNMCAPPTQWQTYDITFRAPRFDSAGERVSPPTLTVWHNDVLIQDKTEAKGPTTAALGGKPTEPAGVYLQDHGNPVEYRNIWLVEL